MPKYLLFLLYLLTFFLFCAVPEKQKESLVNTAHLDHLYEEIELNGDRMGTIWIYCESPDYELVTDEDEGFTCVDDVARTLFFYCKEYKVKPSKKILEKIKSLTEFILYMQADNGFFYNFLLPGNKINTEHQNSQAIANWWSWRAFLALSELNLLATDELEDLRIRTLPVLDTLIGKMELLCEGESGFVEIDGAKVPECLTHLGADQVGVMMVGLSNYYQAYNSERIKNLLLNFGNLLLDVQFGDKDFFPYGAFMSWKNTWHAWGNSQAYALLYTGRIIGHEPFIEAGLKEVKYFYPYCLIQKHINSFRLLQDQGFLFMKDYLQFPQIAYNLRPMIYASLEASAITGDTSYALTAGQLGTWFLGNNAANVQIYDPESGRSCDGIGAVNDVNLNSGAESTIEALLSIQALEGNEVALGVLKEYLEQE